MKKSELNAIIDYVNTRLRVKFQSDSIFGAQEFKDFVNIEEDIETRPIKFRAKKVCSENWVYGSLIRTPSGVFIESYEDSVCNRDSVIPETVCQYTGVRDYTGKEVYEYDIIQDKDGKHYFTIKYLPGSFILYDKYGIPCGSLYNCVDMPDYTLSKEWVVCCSKFDKINAR